jgi:uncharacterized Ntn-hydrolase superfamily protein
MRNQLCCAMIGAISFYTAHAQDTFSIVAVDPITGEVGSAGASCVDLPLFFPNYATDFLGDLIPGQGAINTQASYNTTNQANARTRMLAGDTPQQIISWLVANDVQGNPNIRQYGVAALVNGQAQTAGHTGSNTLNYKNHVAGPTYSVQGNILLGQSILDSMEARFLNEPGDLACKLMAALQGANVVGADTRCNANGTSSLFAFVKVAQPTDAIGAPSFLLSVRTIGGAGIEPIDSLQVLFDAQHGCGVSTGITTARVPDWRVLMDVAGEALVLEHRNGKPDGTGTTFRLVDAQGRTLREGRFTGTTVRIDLQDVAPGLLVVDIEHVGTRYRRKVMR